MIRHALFVVLPPYVVLLAVAYSLPETMSVTDQLTGYHYRERHFVPAFF